MKQRKNNRFLAMLMAMLMIVSTVVSQLFFYQSFKIHSALVTAK